MSKKKNNAMQKIENTTMENNTTINNGESDWVNNMLSNTVPPPEPARAIRNIMKNHREGKITNAQRNAELNTRQRYSKKKQVRMFTDKELKEREKAKKEKENQAAGLYNNFSSEYAAALLTNSEQTKRGGARKTKIKRKKHKRKSRKKRKKTKKKRRKKRKRKTKRK